MWPPFCSPSSAQAERYIISNEFLNYGQLFAMAAAEGGRTFVLPHPPHGDG
jgi:hypothetical protein